MKRIFRLFVILGLAAAVPALYSCSDKNKIVVDNGDDKPGIDNPGEDKPGEGGENEPPVSGEDAIKQFFLDELGSMKRYTGSGMDTYSASDLVNADDIESAQKRVWSLWKAANESFSEEKLQQIIAFDSENDFGYFKLPVELETKWEFDGTYWYNTNEVVKMNYHWGYGGGSKPENGFPAFVYLHGSGGVSSEWNTGYSLCSQDYVKAGPSAYFVPRIPNGITTDGFSFYRWWQKGKQYVWDKIIRQIFLGDSDIDPNRFFFFGISEGAYGSQRLASFYADYLAGVGPIAGGEPLVNAPSENSANIAFCLRTGSLDDSYGRNALTAAAKADFERLQAAHPGYYDHRIDVVEGAYHGTANLLYYDTIPWLINKTRKTNPKYVYWERLEQDGIYRRGFYNLYIPETEKPTERRCYEMTITGNTVDIKVNKVSYTATAWEDKHGMPIAYDKTYTSVSGGKLGIFLGSELVDLTKEVTVNINGKQAWKGIPELKIENLVNSCALYYDPYRLYPAYVEVDL